MPINGCGSLVQPSLKIMGKIWIVPITSWVSHDNFATYKGYLFAIEVHMVSFVIII